ncbi:MAG TPA: hypothetical protein DHW02_20900, partial [Ktedonobacter sp.]|nr:hypothetical protein [Ktedonobacter sp.]
VDSEDVVRNLRPNISLLAQIPARGIIVTSRANSSSRAFGKIELDNMIQGNVDFKRDGEEYDFVSR